jgi:hypothetical protein
MDGEREAVLTIDQTKAACSHVVIKVGREPDTKGSVLIQDCSQGAERESSARKARQKCQAVYRGRHHEPESRAVFLQSVLSSWIHSARGRQVAASAPNALLEGESFLNPKP